MHAILVMIIVVRDLIVGVLVTVLHMGMLQQIRKLVLMIALIIQRIFVVNTARMSVNPPMTVALAAPV